jgi:hypothetical protein
MLDELRWLHVKDLILKTLDPKEYTIFIDDRGWTTIYVPFPVLEWELKHIVEKLKLYNIRICEEHGMIYEQHESGDVADYYEEENSYMEEDNTSEDFIPRAMVSYKFGIGNDGLPCVRINVITEPLDDDGDADDDEKE